MKKIWIMILAITMNNALNAQINLVPNPSFEDTLACPNSVNQVDRAVGWYPSRNSPDYFNECDWINGSLSVPNNFHGYQYAHTGVAYCGLVGYSHNEPNYREDFSCQLNSSLIIGAKYNLSFYMSWAGKFRIACNKIGLLFSTINYDTSNIAPLNNYSQFYTDSIISDSVNWVWIQGSFIADSNYSYLTIGNFFDSSQVDTMRPLSSSHAYYYIDDIVVMQDTTTRTSELILEKTIIFYPNPVHKKLAIICNDNDIYKVEIFDINGKLSLLSLDIQGKKEYEINLSKLKQSFYYLKVYYKNKNSTYHKLLKQ